MANYRGIRPRLLWGSGYANALDLAAPLEDVLSYSRPREGSEWIDTKAGGREAWLEGTDYLLAGRARWIPTETALVGGRRVSGWQGTDGWDAALQWLRDGNTGRYYPDGRNLVISPTMSTDSNADGVVDDWGRQDSGNITANYSIDGANAAQQIAVSASVAGAYRYAQVYQRIYSIAVGETIAFSVECLISGAAGDGLLQIGYDCRQVDGTIVTQTIASVGATGSFARRAVGAVVVPANTAYINFVLRFVSPAGGGTGTVKFRNAMVERKTAASSAFIDNPRYDVLLVEPTQDPPQPQNGRHRELPLLFRATGGALIPGY